MSQDLSYAFFLRFLQAGALAAGNTVLLKPAESTPATSALMAELVHKYLDNDLVRLVNGAIPETTKVHQFHNLSLSHV